MLSLCRVPVLLSYALIYDLYLSYSFILCMFSFVLGSNSDYICIC